MQHSLSRFERLAAGSGMVEKRKSRGGRRGLERKRCGQRQFGTQHANRQSGTQQEELRAGTSIWHAGAC